MFKTRKKFILSEKDETFIDQCEKATTLSKLTHVHILRKMDNPLILPGVYEYHGNLTLTKDGNFVVGIPNKKTIIQWEKGRKVDLYTHKQTLEALIEKGEIKSCPSSIMGM